MTEEEKNELLNAFICYDWIISYTNPIEEKLYLDNIKDKIPSYIKKEVDELKERNYERDGFILSSASINLSLLRLVNKRIPLYKVGNRDISCLADIKCLWDENGLNRSILDWKEYYAIQAYLEPQRLEILKKLEAEKQDKAGEISIKSETLFNWSIDNDKQEVYFNGKLIVELRNKPFKLFCCLYKKRNKFVYNKTLMNAGSYPPKEYDKSFVDMMIKLENTLKKGLDKQGLAIKGKVLEKKRDNKRRNIAYKLNT